MRRSAPQVQRVVEDALPQPPDGLYHQVPLLCAIGAGAGVTARPARGMCARAGEAKIWGLGGGGGGGRPPQTATIQATQLAAAARGMVWQGGAPARHALGSSS